MKAIIPAAGLGTRFLPATKVVPKELLPVLDKPVLQYIVEEGLAAPECDSVVVIKSEAKGLIEDYFQRNIELEAILKERGKHAQAEAVEHAGILPLQFIDQHEALGLGHAVYCAEYITKEEPFYVLLGDVIVPENSILPKLHSVSASHGGASVLAVIKVDEDEVDRFGVIDADEIEPGVFKVKRLVEKPKKEEAPSRYAIFGRYLLSSRVMKILEHTGPGVGDEIQLTDALSELLASEEMYAVLIDEKEGFDTGTISSWIETNMIMSQRDERYRAEFEAVLKKLHA